MLANGWVVRKGFLMGLRLVGCWVVHKDESLELLSVVEKVLN